jgi:hypothetical protein
MKDLGREQGGWRLLTQLRARMDVREVGKWELVVTMRRRQGIRGFITLIVVLGLGLGMASRILWAGHCHGNPA